MLACAPAAARPLALQCGLRALTPLAEVACGFRSYQKSARDPRHGGFFNKNAANVGTSLVGKASRGDVLKLQLTVEDGVIKDARFKSLGCGSSAASSTAATERILGRPLDTVEQITSQLHLESADGKSATLAKEAILAAVADYRKKHEAVSCHFKTPRNLGALDQQAPDVGTALVGKASLGGVVKMQVKVEDGIIRDAKFKAVGCESAVASSSFATEMIIGRTIEQAESLSSADIASQLKLPPSKVYCSVLAEGAVRAAIAAYRAKRQCVQDHFSTPRNVGALDAKAVDVGTGSAGKASQGGVIRMQIKVADGLIAEAKFRGIGCSSTLASSSYVTESIIGRSIADGESVTDTEVACNLLLPRSKIHCSALAVEAAQAAIANYKGKCAFAGRQSLSPCAAGSPRPGLGA